MLPRALACALVGAGAALALALLAGCGDGGSADDADGADVGGGSAVGPSSAGSFSNGSSSATSGSGGSGAGGEGSGEGGASSGGLPACVDDTILVLEGQTTVECMFDLPYGTDRSKVNLALDTGTGPTMLCAHASSQGCQSGGGWWAIGSHVMLCDSTCSQVVDTASSKLHLWIGCATESCN